MWGDVMYGDNLAAYVRRLAERANVPVEHVRILDDSLACLLASLAHAVQGESTPKSSLLTVSARLLLLTEALAGLPPDADTEGLHYLVALGYEQTAAEYTNARESEPAPLDDDRWYRLAFAVLHYLAGGFRVQAFTALRALEQVGDSEVYKRAATAINALFAGGADVSPAAIGARKEHDATVRAMRRLAAKVGERRGVLLADLGENDPGDWLSRRGIDVGGAEFWANYLTLLRKRGITAFTADQGRFDEWLTLSCDLVVLLPTGGGKTIVGELMTALACAAGKSVVWLVPTRALVRQTRRYLQAAFGPLGVDIQELPTTEDFVPMFAEDAFTAERQIAVTTPERLSSFVRSNPGAMSEVGVLVFDEAHLLLDAGRGVTAEALLTAVKAAVPTCRFVLMSGAPDTGPLLPRFLAVEQQPFVLTSNLRPTRRVYGALTDIPVVGGTSTVLALFPPVSVATPGSERHHFELRLPPTKRKPISGPTEVASRFAEAAAAARLRTVLFVTTKNSTESRAEHVARRVARKPTPLPEGAIARLELELGRPSALLSTAVNGIAAHHGGLTSLEQHLVERWVEEGRVRVVFATPTLAQGINLPFDMSIVTFTGRYENERWRELDPGEIMNMLGRAGRAGWVADGLCAIAEHASPRGALPVLAGARKIFFAPEVQRRGLVGLADVLFRTATVFGSEGWTAELGTLRGSEIQTVLSIATRAGAADITEAPAIANMLAQYPSFAGVPAESVGFIAAQMARVVQELRSTFEGDPVTREVTVRTGMPPDYVRHVTAAIRQLSFDTPPQPSWWIDWADSVVKSAMEAFAEKPWHREVFGELTAELLFRVVPEWRSGATIAQIEKVCRTGPVPGTEGQERGLRIRVGAMLNHELSFLSQLWGVIPACGEALGAELVVEQTRPFAAMTRDGVPDADALVWLRTIGGVDRVLATQMSAHAALPSGALRDKAARIRRALGQWRAGRNAPPVSAVAIRAVADEALR